MITPDGSHILLAAKLNFEVTNNMTEYEAYIAGMEAHQELGVKEVEVFGDSTLDIAQTQKIVEGERGTLETLSTIFRGFDQNL